MSNTIVGAAASEIVLKLASRGSSSTPDLAERELQAEESLRNCKELKLNLQKENH